MRKLAVMPGAYAIRGWRNGATFAGRVDVHAGELRIVRGDELVETALGLAVTKGGRRSPAGRQATMSLTTGTQRGIAAHVGPMLALSTAIRAAGAHGWSAAVDLAIGRATGFRESSAAALGGYFVGRTRGALRVDLGLHLGGGIVRQHRDGGGSATSPTAMLVPWLSAAVALTDRCRWSAPVSSRAAGSDATRATRSPGCRPATSASPSISRSASRPGS